jgi:glycine/D-amino acid oxidase-like deaminating enzyme
MSAMDFAASVDRAARDERAPAITGTGVLALDRFGDGYRVRTERGDFTCDSVVIATGDCAVPKVPRSAADLPADVLQLTTRAYKRPFEPDQSWVNLPVFDGKGRIRHRGGFVTSGLCVMGLSYVRTARSTRIAVAARDARALARQLVNRPARRAAA